MLAPTTSLPALPATMPVTPPTPRQRQATWGTILLSLTVFWYLVALGVDALWGSFAG